MFGIGSRRSVVRWMAAAVAAGALGACIIVTPPPATPIPAPTATPTSQTMLDVVRVVEGGAPAVSGQAIRVELTLEEGTYRDRSRWQWERSDDGLSGWTVVAGARLTDSSLYAPAAADVDKYLRASVHYVDSKGVGKIGLSSIMGPVETADIDTTTVTFALGDDPVVVTRAVKAGLTLANTQYSQAGRWRWDRSTNGLRGWIDVTDYDSKTPSVYLAGSSDQNKYLRASIVYLDSDGDLRRGLSQTIGPVIVVETEAGVAGFTAGSTPPTVGTAITAALNLAGGQFSGLGFWKWERSPDGLRSWKDVTDYEASDSARYLPSSSDLGGYLRASVLYVDSDGDDKRGLTQTIGPVVE